eukprot:CFRG6355T1
MNPSNIGDDDYWVVVPCLSPVANEGETHSAKSKDNTDDLAYTQQLNKEETSREVELQLEDCMNDEYLYIVVNNYGLGCQVAVSIKAGNFLHKSAVIGGVFCLLAAASTRGRLTPVQAMAVCLPLGIGSVVSALLYELSWSHDPVCHYQIVPTENYLTDIPMLEQLEAERLPQQVILRRRNDKVRRHLHKFVATGAAFVCIVNLYRWFSR